MNDCLADKMILTKIVLAVVEMDVKKAVMGGWLDGCDLGSIDSWLN